MPYKVPYSAKQTLQNFHTSNALRPFQGRSYLNSINALQGLPNVGAGVPHVSYTIPDIDLTREFLSYGTPKPFTSPGFGGIPEIEIPAPKTSLNTSVFTGADKVAPKSTKVSKSKGKLFKEGGFFDTKSGKLSGIVDDVANPQFDYDTKTGVKGWGKNLGTLWNIGQMALQGYNAAQDLQSAGEASDRAEDLLSQITTASYNSPTLQYDLSPEQLDTLRQIREGDFDTSADLDDLNLLSLLGDTAMGVLGGIPGGISGMVLGGLGGLGTGLSRDYSNAQARQASELEALYQAVLASEQQHNDLRKQRAYASYGLGGY